MTNEIADAIDGGKDNRLNGDVSKELCLKKELSGTFFLSNYILSNFDRPTFDDEIGCE